MSNVLIYEQIDRTEWRQFVRDSKTGTWFQTPEAFEFFAAQPELFKPFVFGVTNDQSKLRGVCSGFVTVEKNPLKQFLTRRAIIIGGPVLADDATDDEVTALMSAVKHELKNQAIYVETRNFNDYSKWKDAFASAGFEYQPHLNFHVDTTSMDVVETNLGKSRKRDIKTTIREGVTIVNSQDIKDKSKLDSAVHEYYLILKNLYEAKVKTPLFPESFFHALANNRDGRLLLTAYNGKIIGGTVCVELTQKCLYEWFVCGEDGVYPHIFPSSYATYAGICHAAEHGCARFDMMGAGKPDEAYGVRDFKARFGGTEVQHGRFLCVTKPFLYNIGVWGVKILKNR